MRLAEFLNLYLATRFSLSPGYRDELRQAIAMLERWSGQTLGLADLSDSLVNSWLASLVAAGRAPATVNSRRRELLTLWKSAASKGLCASPGEVGRAKEPRRIPRALPVKDLERLVACCRILPGSIAGVPESGYWPALFLTQYATGARIGALRVVRPLDMDLVGRFVVLRAEDQKQNADQVLYLTDQAVAAIARIWCPQREFLWPWPYHPKSFNQRVRRLFALAGIQPTGRHCGLTHAIRRRTLTTCWSVDPAIAQRQAGHADSRTTLDHYVDGREVRGLTAADILPALDLPGAERQLRLF